MHGNWSLWLPPLHALLTIREIPDPLMKGRDTMNIFKNSDSFFGCLDSGSTEDSLLSLFKLAKQIRQRMGKQGYLLDCYLSLVFEGAICELTFDAADEGTRTGSEFQSLLFHVMDGTEPKHPHPLYQRVREVYEQHTDKLVFQERYTNLCQLLFPLADEIMKYAAGKYVEEHKSDLNSMVDIIRVQELYDQISHLAGESMMEELNQKIKQRFLIVPVTSAFAQGFTDELLFKLTSRDHETSKQMFQLLLDSMPSDEGR